MDKDYNNVFKYHPSISDSSAVAYKDGKCQCCGNQNNIFVNNMYCKDEVECICLDCVYSGMAADKFDGTFIQDAEYVDDKEKREELFKRTPGYISWQGEHWLACCNDYCAFLKTVGIKELEELGVADELIHEYEVKSGFFLKRSLLTKNGIMVGYLFRCLHCDKYHLWVDMN